MSWPRRGIHPRRACRLCAIAKAFLPHSHLELMAASSVRPGLVHCVGGSVVAKVKIVEIQSAVKRISDKGGSSNLGPALRVRRPTIAERQLPDDWPARVAQIL